MLFGKFLVSFILLFFYLDCGPANGSKPNTTPVNDVPAETPIKQEQPAAVPNDVMITLERGVCFGRCPQYTLTIESNGSVIFDGKKDTKVLGKAKGTISREDLIKLISEFEKVKFFQLEDRYDYKTCPVAATDAPSATVSLRLNGKAKTVYHYLGCVENNSDHTSYPPGLLELEKKIDDAAGSKRWTVNE